MSQSERLALIQKQATKYVARNKCVDSSVQTMRVQSLASATPTPGSVPLACGVARGKGANGEYIGILQKAQGCAICADEPQGPRSVILDTPCINQQAPPFTQQNMSQIYVPPCTPGNASYPWSKVFDPTGCKYARNTTPSG
jgi:hypothetical protein